MPTTSMNNPTQTLDEACAELHRMVDSFKLRWMERRATNPDYYPLDMTEGQWFDNFMTEATMGDGL